MVPYSKGFTTETNMKKLLRIIPFIALIVSIPVYAALVSKPYTFSNNHVADATQVNADFDTLYSLVNGNLSRTNFANPLQLPNITGDLNLFSGADVNIYSDTGTTLKFKIDGATGDFGIPTARKFYLDGTALSGDSYIYQPSANVPTIVAGGVGALEVRSTYVHVNGVDAVVDATKKFYLDSGGNTYLSESSSDVLRTTVGASTVIEAATTFLTLYTDVAINTTKRFYLDSGSDTYISEVSANVIRLVGGGSNIIDFRTSITDLYSDFSILSTDKFYFDGGANTSFRESSADTITAEAGGTDSFSIKSTGLGIPAGSKYYLDGVTQAGDTYLTNNSVDGIIEAFSNSTNSFTILNTGVGIPATNQLFLDGVTQAGNTSIREASADLVAVKVGGTDSLFVNSDGVITSTRQLGEVINCEVNYSAGTITISGRDGVALSATNPCYVGTRGTSNGVVHLAKFTSNVTLTDGAASNTDGNLFGITNVDWANEMPFFIGVVSNAIGDYFTISRVPLQVTGSAVGDVCQKNDTDCDSETDAMILATGLTLSTMTSANITQIGWLQATYATAGSAWTFSESVYTGFNFEYENVWFTMATGQHGADSGSYLYGNTATAPSWATPANIAYKYKISRNAIGNFLFTTENAGNATNGSAGLGLSLALPYNPYLGISGTDAKNDIPCGAYHVAGATAGTAGILNCSIRTDRVDLYDYSLNVIPCNGFSSTSNDINVTVSLPIAIN